MLIDVDLARQLPERILIQREEVEFFIFIDIENCLDFCNLYGAVGHHSNACNSRRSDEVSKSRQSLLSKKEEDRTPIVNIEGSNLQTNEVGMQESSRNEAGICMIGAVPSSAHGRAGIWDAGSSSKVGENEDTHEPSSAHRDMQQDMVGTKQIAIIESVSPRAYQHAFREKDTTGMLDQHNVSTAIVETVSPRACQQAFREKDTTGKLDHNVSAVDILAVQGNISTVC